MTIRIFISVFLALMLFGCTNPSPPQNPNASDIQGISSVLNQTGQNITENFSSSNQTIQEEATQAAIPQDSTESKSLLLLGRSVSQGWANFMGLEWDDEGTMSGTFQGHQIRRYEVESPPLIADSAIEAMDRFDSDFVFFKLCFVDFSSEANENLAENEQYVQKVYAEASKRNRKLIVENALPQVSAYTGDGLRYNHREYNKWLDDFASTHPGIEVLDLYGMLSDSNGNLRADYAIAPDDSHLNEKAYAAITPKLMEIVEAVKEN